MGNFYVEYSFLAPPFKWTQHGLFFPIALQAHLKYYTVYKIKLICFSPKLM